MSSTAAKVSIGFFVYGFLSLLTGLTLLLLDPEIVLGDPYRAEVLALAHLLVLGWVSSVIFGAAYMILPVMAATPLWSRKLAWGHWLLHAIGLPWMVISFWVWDFAEVGHGGSVVFIGIVFFAINLISTSSRFNRWEPAHATLLSALFWLLVTAGIGLFMLANKYIPMTTLDPQWLVGVHAHMGLLGFFWLILLGAGLKLVPMFMVSSRTPGWASWAGWVMINTALLLMLPMDLAGRSAGFQWLVWMMAVGSLLYAWDLARMIFASRRKFDWGLATAGCGLLTAGLIFIWLLAGSPGWQGEEGNIVREQARTYFVLSILGVFTLGIFGMAGRIIPFLVWQIRLAPLVGHQPLPTVRELVRPYGQVAVFISMATAWAYLAAGQLTGQPAGIQIGAMLFLIGFVWFAYNLEPAFRVMICGPSDSKAGKTT